MSKFQNRFCGFWFVIILTSATAFSQNNNVATAQSTPDAEIAEKVKIAFEKAVKYDFKPLKEIETYGKKLIPYLEPYLSGSDLSIGYLALDLVKNGREPEYIPLFLVALRSSDIEMSHRASLYLYDNFDHQMLARNAVLGDALRQSALKGNHSLSSIILLGYFPEPATEKALLSIPTKTSLAYWTNDQTNGFDMEIDSTVPVYLSLYRIERGKYAARFAELVTKTSSGEIEFLLYALNYIDDSALLKLIFEKGIVDRKILPSEYGFEGDPPASPIRTKDLTVTQFARKLNLNLGFKVQETRYSPKKINIARQKIAAKLAAL